MTQVRQTDIAERLGISPQAVGFALSTRADLRRKVAENTRRKVVRTAQQMGYVPHRAAQALARGKTDTFIILVPDQLHHPHIHELLQALQHAVRPHGYKLVFEMIDPADDLTDTLQGFSRANCDGVILMTWAPEWPPASLTKWRKRVPLVIAGPCDSKAVFWATYDRRQAAELATGHLLDRGHRHVLLVFDVRDNPVSQQRVQGYRAAHAARGVAVDERLLLRSPVETNVTELADRILQSKPRPTALFCYNDELTLRLLQTLHRRGIRVPQDMALVALPNSRLTTMDEVPLTAMDTNHPGVARAVIDMLLEQVRDPKARPRHALVEPHLVVRESSGPPRRPR